MSSSDWQSHATPFKQIVIKLQGTRHSDIDSILNQLAEIGRRIRDGITQEAQHDDDFGFEFSVELASSKASIFGDEPAHSS